MATREHWEDLARELDWEHSYVPRCDAFPAAVSGELPDGAAEWNAFHEARCTSFSELVAPPEHERAGSIAHAAAPGSVDGGRLNAGYRSATKLFVAGSPLRGFAAVVADLRAARFARTTSWRTAALLHAFEALGQIQATLLLAHEHASADAQFDWARKLMHSEHWFAIAARHHGDDLLAGDPVERAVAGGFVCNAIFGEPQLAAFEALARSAGDHGLHRLLRDQRTDAARAAARGARLVLGRLAVRDRGRAQQLVDKWFWRSWLGFALVTGSAVDYLVPLAQRRRSFKELIEETVLPPFVRALRDNGLALPWYWPDWLDALDGYHHMVYASMYSYRRTLWFDAVLPGPDERAWLRSKYPASWDGIAAIWDRIAARWNEGGPGVEWYAHATAPAGLCNLCQLPLCGGTPDRNSACTRLHGGRRRIFCSEPCAWIFEREPERYGAHRDLIARAMAGQAPANLLALITRYFGLSPATWGGDACGGNYAWLGSPP